MNTFWPHPYEDELLYSVCARYADRLRRSGHKPFMDVMLGGLSFQAVVDLPANLGMLCERLFLDPSGGEDFGEDVVAETMRCHTMFPLYAPFQWPHGLAEVQAAMRGKCGPTVHCRLGVMAGRVRPPRWMRCCSRCDQSDLAIHKEHYWRRVHQVPGVEICPHHGVPLVASSQIRHDPSTRHAFVPRKSLPFEPRAARSPKFIPATKQLLMRLGRGAAWLLLKNRRWGCAAQVRNLYRSILAERDIISGGGSVRWEQLINEFGSRYTQEVLDLLQCGMSQDGKRILWMERLLRSKTAAQSPIRHLLMMDFLGYGAEKFFGLMEAEAESIFGKIGWPCLNPVCTQNGNFCIENVYVKRSGSPPVRPVGVFRCGACGFAYARYGPDRQRGRITQADWVVEYGELWNSVLKSMWNDPQASLRATARCLQVDPVTVKRLVSKLGLDPRAKSRRENITKMCRTTCAEDVVPDGHSVEISRDDHREQWRAALRTGFYNTRTEARRAHPALYAWLYRHDRIWLQQQLLFVKRTTPSDDTPHRFDAAWALRDLEASVRVREKADLLRNASDKPRRVSVAAIARLLGVRAYIQKHPKRMPRTVQMLQQCAEDRLAFAERRLIWIAGKVVPLNSQIPRWRLLKMAGLRPEIAQSRKIASMLDALSRTPSSEVLLAMSDG